MVKKLILKNIRNKLITISSLVILFQCGSSIASNLNYKIIGDDILYRTSVEIGNLSTTANWFNVTDLKTVNAFQPGQIIDNLGKNKLKFLSSKGDSFEFDININGISYGGIDTSFSRENSELDGSIPTTGGINEELVNSGNPGQFSNKMYRITSGSTVSSFKVVRPIFQIDDKALLRALKKGNIKTGIYRASLPLTYKYRVKYSHSSFWTYEIRSILFSLEINYTAKTLESIEVFGDGNIKAEYIDHSSKVKGNTKFNVTAKGVMPDGIMMTFVDKARNFHLRTALDTIPYNVYCSGTSSSNCNEKNLVIDGNYVAKQDKLVITPKRGNENDFNFDILIDFDSTFVRSGIYSDNFVIIFEVVI